MTSSRLRKPVALLLLVALLIVTSWWLYQRATHVYTNDARVAANMIAISSKVPGWVVNFPVGQGQKLAKNDLIMAVDTREAKLKTQELEAQLQSVNADYERGLAEQDLVRHQTDSQVLAAEAQLDASNASLQSAKSELQVREHNWTRAQSLRDKQIISEERWEGVRNDYQRAKQARQVAISRISAAQAKLVEASANRSKLKVIGQQLAMLRAKMQQTEIQLQRQRLDVDDRTVRSPLNAIVDQTFVNSGEYIVPGQRVALVHDAENVWIKANIKETEVRHIGIGNRVRIDVDAYPDQEFFGEVVHIGDAATSQFALLPNASPSGNFTKVTQRLPIKVSVDQRNGLLKPGMMVELSIDI